MGLAFLRDPLGHEMGLASRETHYSMNVRGETPNGRLGATAPGRSAVPVFHTLVVPTRHHLLFASFFFVNCLAAGPQVQGGVTLARTWYFEPADFAVNKAHTLIARLGTWIASSARAATPGSPPRPIFRRILPAFG
jgi:hypothetical protein